MDQEWKEKGTCGSHIKKKDEKQTEAKWKGERQNVSKERKILVLFFS